MRQKTKKLQTLKFEKPVSSHLKKNTYTHEILSVAKRGQQKVTPLILWMNFVASSFVVEWTHNNCWMAWSEYFQFFLLQLTNLWKSAPKKLLIFSASILYFFSYLYFGCFFLFVLLVFVNASPFFCLDKTFSHYYRICDAKDDNVYVTAFLNLNTKFCWELQKTLGIVKKKSNTILEIKIQWLVNLIKMI